MPEIMAQVAFPYDSGLPEDVSINTFHFNEEVVDSDPDALVEALQNFYTATYTGETGPIAAYLSSTLGGPARVKLYDLEDTPPRVPILEDTFTYTPNTGTGGLPEELTVCFSFQATPVSGAIQARRRGRIYFGPLSLLAIEGAGSSDTVWPMPARPAVDLKTRACKAMENLQIDATAAGYSWCVRSQVTGLLAEIHNGWVDDAFDIQRRRGVRPTARTTWSMTD